MGKLDALFNIGIDILEGTGAVEVMRQELARYLDKWPDREAWMARFRLLSNEARRSVVHRIALHIAVHKLDNAQLIDLVNNELARAERG